MTGVERGCGESGSVAAARLVREVAESCVPTFIDTRDVWTPVSGPLDRTPGVVPVEFPAPSAATRRAWWEQSLVTVGVSVDPSVADALADHFRLDASQIAEAVLSARNRAEWTGTAVDAADLFATARSHSGARSRRSPARCGRRISGTT